MRKWQFFFGGVALFIIQLLMCSLGQENVFANTSNYYIDDFTADYYLSRDEEGISHLKVREKITAVFPNFNQNKGICRYISFTNQDGANITLPRLTRSDVVVTRNGQYEPIYSIDKNKDYYEVCTGDESYVLGTQEYELQYEFEKVVTDFSNYQELYWDTNGNGWTQRFNSVTARVHFAEDLLDEATGETWCYVGRYMESGQGRCVTTRTEDGFMFVTKNLASGENLTFDVEIKPGTFVVPEPAKNYLAIIIVFIVAVVCALIVFFSVRKYLQIKEKLEYYDGIFVKPEYQPDGRYSLAEMAEIYIGKKKDMEVGMLLNLIVSKQISLVKKPGKSRQWEIIVNNLEGVSGEELDLLMIINGGKDISEGAKFDIKKHNATTKLADLDQDLRKKLLGNLKRDGLVEKNYRIGARVNMGISKGVIYNTIVNSIFFILIGGFFLLGFYANIEEFVTGQILFEKGSMIITFGLMAMTIIVCEALRNKRATVENHTKAGLLASRYMDGLRLYIEMAEADRMKMLQSIEGVDVSPEGIVKLYEKLLPYAAIFGLEESWMNEMNKYCRVEEIEQPDWLMTGVAISEISRAVRDTANYVSSSTVMANSGGGSSSGFSGGGGGGFSGGGGGGGFNTVGRLVF